jgi:hypothetical protein
VSQKKRFLLRLEQELYEVLEKWAADDIRSVNAQVEYLLKKAALQSKRWRPKESKEAIKPDSEQ